MRLFCSFITTAAVPSGVKYRLYGRWTGIDTSAGTPVVGSIGTSRFDALAFAYNVRRSQEGTTCWTRLPIR